MSHRIMVHGRRVRRGNVRVAIVLAAVALGRVGGAAQSGGESWTVSNVGNPSIPGTALVSACASNEIRCSALTVSATGGDVWGDADQLTFVQRELTGDGSIVARVAGIANTNAWAKAGLMVRDSLGPGAANAFVFATPENGVGFQRRTGTGQQTSRVRVASAAVPRWLKLERQGALVSASESEDGRTWTLIGRDRVALQSTVFIGVGVVSREPYVRTVAALTDVSVHEGASDLPEGWSFTDVGWPERAGAAIYSNGTFGLAATNTDVQGSSDQFSYAYRIFSGDIDVVTRVARLNGGNPRTKAGLMIREALDPGSAHVSIFATSGEGVAVQTRSSEGLASSYVGAGSTVAPVWLKLQRRDDVITAFESVNGQDWTVIGTATFDVSTPAYVGLALSSADPSQAADAVFDHVDMVVAESRAVAVGGVTGTDLVAPGGSIDQSVALALNGTPNGWSSRDIGAPAMRGDAQFASGTFTLEGAGRDIWDTSDQFHFAYRQMDGDVDIVSRVTSLEYTHFWAKGGLMIRASLSATSAHASIFVTPAEGVAFQRRTSTGGVSANTGGGNGTAPIWLRLQRKGSTITASRSSDGSRWTVVGSQTLSLPAQVYVGLAVSSVNESRAATATFTSVTLNGSGSGPANQPPTVALTAPANGATFAAPATVALAATAADPDGTVSRVNFYAGTTLIGSDTSSPYAFNWTGVPAGTYSITAVVSDADGASGTSAARTITVQASSNNPPTVALTAPSNGATFGVPASLTLTATAADSDGTIARVEFYAGTTLIGSDTSSPYRATWNDVPAGSHTLTAVAIDSASARTTSAPIAISVGSVPSLTRQLRFTPSADHSTVQRYTLEIFAASANPATATPARTQDLGKPAVVSGECAVDITQVYSALAPGSYIATVTAISGGGSRRSSASPTFTR